MSNLVNLINTAFMEERKIDINQFINKYKESNVLKATLHDYGPFNNFNSMIWKFFDEITQNINTLNFNIFNNLIDTEVISNQDLLLIKCFSVDRFFDGYGYQAVYERVKSIHCMISITNNFSVDDDNKVSQLLRKDTKNTITSVAIIDYIDFLESVDCANDGHLIVLSYFYDNPRYFFGNRARKLPQSSDIFAFDYYLKKFYKEETDNVVKNLYKPVLLWWKITNVIPMRPTEFAYKLKRDCLKIEDGKYYIYIDRVKVNKNTSNKRKKHPSIPILRRIGITKDMYDLIQDYIDCTSFDDSSETLLSYVAYKHFHKEYYTTYKPDLIYTKIIAEDGFKKIFKRHSNLFNRDTLEILLENFYREIIIGKYKNSSIKDTLNLGDTRHLAFCSLLLQGISPVEIAMLGGHTTLAAQNHYTAHAKYYIDSEMLNFMAHRTVNPEIDNKELKEIILNKPRKPYKDLDKCHSTKDKIGYCTADFENDVCDSNKRTCILCTKWWCYPSNNNYVKAREYIKIQSIEPLKEKLSKEEEFLAKILKTAKVVNINELLELDKSCDEDIQRQVKQIRSTADEILFLQKILVEIEEKDKTNS